MSVSKKNGSFLNPVMGVVGLGPFAAGSASMTFRLPFTTFIGLPGISVGSPEFLGLQGTPRVGKGLLGPKGRGSYGPKGPKTRLLLVNLGFLGFSQKLVFSVF